MSTRPRWIAWDLERLRRCFEQLPLPDQQVLFLHHVCEHSAAEIATLLGTTRGAILARLHRARRRLLALMTEEPECVA